MKKKLLTAVLACTAAFLVLTGCGSKVTEGEDVQTVETKSEAEEVTTEESTELSDEERAKEVADLIDAIYVQQRTDETDELCEKAKAVWDALTDRQIELVEGEEADPDYFGRDTGDASKDDPLNGNDIVENEILVVSFGTSFNDAEFWI